MSASKIVLGLGILGSGLVVWVLVMAILKFALFRR